MRFTSGLDEDTLEQISRASIAKFRQLPGLKQKYYLRDAATGVLGGVYIFETEQAARAYVDGPIVATVADRYKMPEPPAIEVMQIEFTLDD